MIYFLASQDRNVLKIGHTNNVARRIAEHSKEHCRQFVLLGTCPGSDGDENRAHAVMKSHRIGGEWYWLCPTVAAFVDLAVARGIRTANSTFASGAINHCQLVTRR